MSQYGEEIKKILFRALENIAQALCDDYVQKNAEFRSSAGLKAKIIRRMNGETCEWCRALAGTYEYGTEPAEVYQRHDNCDCTVEFVTEKGAQNVHTKQWTTPEERAKIEARKQVGLEPKQRQFRSKKLLQKHFKKHAEEFGAISIPEYLNRANALIDKELSDDVVSLLRSDGSTSKYCFSTNEFVITNADGTIRTYFKPKRKEAYWQYELDRN